MRHVAPSPHAGIAQLDPFERALRLAALRRLARGYAERARRPRDYLDAIAAAELRAVAAGAAQLADDIECGRWRSPRRDEVLARAN